MKIPEKIKIGGLTYDVEITDHLVLGCDYGGEILFQDLKIQIRPMAKERMEVSFLHEVVHGIYESLGYTEHDEKRVDELAHTLHGLIKDNPELFKKGGKRKNDKKIK